MNTPRWTSILACPSKKISGLDKQECMSYSAAFLFLLLSLPLWASPWGEEYFPNTALTTHEGKSVRFFDDLIKDKIVVVNFICCSVEL